MNWALGYSIREKSKWEEGGWGYTFLKTPLKFFIFLSPPQKSQTKQAQPLDIQQMLDLLEIPRPKTKTTCYFFDTPGNSIHSISINPHPPFLDFFCLHKSGSLFHLKGSFRSRDIHIFVIFFLPFHAFQIRKDKWKWSNLWCHKLTSINLQM